MSEREALIAAALSARFGELCDCVSRLSPANFGEMSGFVSEVRAKLVDIAAVGATGRLRLPTSWLEADSDCLNSLRRLALGESLPAQPASQPESEGFVQKLRATRNDGEQAFLLLTQRYACPLNFALQSESQTQEYVLERLMVQDRLRIEKNSMDDAAPDLLLRLNLIAVHASTSSDLRFLDALNYYYELIPSNWRSHADHDWLLVSYFALYARAVAARL